MPCETEEFAMNQDADALAREIEGKGPSQILRKLVIATSISFAAVFLLIAASEWEDGSALHEGIEWVGIALIVICILGRTWSTLFIGGRKNKSLTIEGPYSITRNPLYLFSIIGAVGVGAQFGSITVALVSGLFAWLVFLWTVWREEAALLLSFGDDYRRYMARVPRFLPRASLWHSPPTLIVNPQLIATTFFDAAIFLVAIPIAEAFEWMHAVRILPTLLIVP
jgi:protein-S-isoprenylcysteine O-methyltransferase Ste14